MENSTTREERESANSILTTMLQDVGETESKYHMLNERGYSKEEIGLIISYENRKKRFSGKEVIPEIQIKVYLWEGKETIIGGVAGSIVGAWLAIGIIMLIPGLEKLFNVPLPLMLVGVIAGGFSGGVIGGLIGSGKAKDRQKLQELGIKNGILIPIKKPKNIEFAKYFENNWNLYKGEEISAKEGQYQI